MVVLRRSALGPILYGLAWAVVGPAILLWWAVATADVVTLPAIQSPLAGALLGAGGVGLMALGMGGLAAYGHGLPMNAYPPPLYVAQGIYGWLSHPIYVGFVLLAAGVSIACGSASGLWLVTPVTALLLAALVLGYEGHDLRRRFGEQVHRPRLALPRATEGTADWWERLSIYLLVLLPWFLAYEAVQFLGAPADAIPGYLRFEYQWPVIEWTEAIYSSAYLMVMATPLLVRSRLALHRLAVAGLVATAVVTLIYLAVPLTAPPRPFEPTTALGRLLAFERSLEGVVGAFPSFHVLWALLAADALASRGRVWGAAAYLWALLIAVSTITTGMHAVVDIVAAVLLFPLFRRYDAVWASLRRGSEWIANSWREWRFGPVRVINHGFYTGIGGALGTWLAGRLAGPDLLPCVVIVGIGALVLAALWAQYLEGSSVLLRPLGFYGGLIGGLLVTGALGLSGVDVIPLLGALAVAMPWVQAAGRMRCLVQGCCHGGPATPSVGICYRHSRSRVTQIAGLTGAPLYPTPLYSVLSNLVTGILLWRLWALGASPALVAGLYLILNSVARFVEESYRAEPQTPVVAGLRLYQWLSFIGFAAGVLFTTLKTAPPPAPMAGADPWLLAAALLMGGVAWFVTGVDFPGSNRRFSRLAAADDPPRLLP